MPTVKFERIVSCNSEDHSFPASNLLESESYKKWKCKSAGEEQAVVILQLEKPTLISGIDIGNEGSAFVEVLVGRQSSDEFKVLLLASSFMSPAESKNDTNKNRVRMFSKDQLCETVVDEKWDRVKVVCRQPFNRYQQYGLCFITLHSPESHKLGRFEIKDEDVGSYKAGCLFARRKEQLQEESLKGAAAIRAASRPEVLLKNDSKRNKELQESEQKRNTPSPHTSYSSEKPKMTANVKRKSTSPPPHRTNSFDLPKKPKIGDSSGGKKSPSLNQSSPLDKPMKKMNLATPSTHVVSSAEKTKKAKVSSDVKNGITPVKRPASSDKNSAKKVKGEDKQQQKKKALRKPFHKLLEGVVFVISGYQNPERGDVRSMALEMGAKYKPDWDRSCTHLICAFMNTPKYQQVHGKGHIVRKEWVEQCHSRRARIPWRRHALDKREQSKPESEDEILEEVPQSPVRTPAESESDPEMGSGSDTEDEIERIRAAANTSNASSDTEIDEPDTPPDTSSLPWPSLPNSLVNLSFYLRPEDHEHEKLIRRYIVANGGSILSTNADHVDYIVSEESADVVKEELEQWPKAEVVDYAWVIDKLRLKIEN